MLSIKRMNASTGAVCLSIQKIRYDFREVVAQAAGDQEYPAIPELLHAEILENQKAAISRSQQPVYGSRLHPQSDPPYLFAPAAQGE
jgi:hypothetical protein